MTVPGLRCVLLFTTAFALGPCPRGPPRVHARLGSAKASSTDWAARADDLGSPFQLWHLTDNRTLSEWVTQTRGARGLSHEDGYKGFVFARGALKNAPPASPTAVACVVRELEWDEGKLGGTVWESSIAWGAFVTAFPDIVAGKRCLELGSGCGLAGLATAAAGAAEVVLSDYGSVDDGTPEDEARLLPTGLVPNLRHTARLNQPTLPRCPLSVRNLDWVAFAEHPPGAGHDRDGERFEVVFGTDLFYYPEIIPALVDTVLGTLRDDGVAWFLMCGDSQERGAKYVPLFVDLLRQHGEVEITPLTLQGYARASEYRALSFRKGSC